MFAPIHHHTCESMLVRFTWNWRWSSHTNWWWVGGWCLVN